MLQLGSKGPEVKKLQEKLIARGYSVGSYGADGDFGQGTHNAVVKFQRDHGLSADGIVGPDTMRAIDGAIGTTILKYGDKGPAVLELQKKIVAKGYSVGANGPNGDFGQATYEAVMLIQLHNNLTVDGIVGPATWSVLNGFSNGNLLKKGDKGLEVKSLQEKLITRGYSVGSYGADGDFGQGTHDAVVKFQRDNSLSPDGVVGPATWEVLNGINANLVLRKGDKGPKVKSLQEKLIARGYSVGVSGADGDFGQGTHDAVVRFQRDNGLSADGVVGAKTFYALNANPSGTLLKLGSKGEEVRNLQERLMASGYSVGSYGADGDFGQGTHDAVVKFQRDNGLSADGVVGPATWAALGTNDTLLRLGSKGAEVKRLQERLITKGYSVGSYGADGDFGQGTHDAVVRFQRDNGLSADGVVGPATWSALNDFGDWNPGVGGVAGVKKMLNAAKSQVGVKEVPVNITPYGAWYGMNGVAWCAIFVSWAANQGGILGNVVPKFHWCADGVNWFKARGRYMTRAAGTPESGDVIFFYRSNDAFYHVGIVNYVANGRVHTVEGNATDAVRSLSYSLTDSRIHGYGRNGGIVDTDGPGNGDIEYKATGKVFGAGELNIRTGPSTSHSIVGRIAEGEFVTIIAKNNEWYKISSPRDGYVQAKYIQIKAGEEIIVGSKVKVIGTHWATGQVIPNWVKNEEYIVGRIESDRALLEGINSWAYLKDLVLVSGGENPDIGDEDIEFSRVLSLGMSGNDVKYMHKLLNKIGYYDSVITTEFDGETKKSVREYQKVNGVYPNGSINKALWDSIVQNATSKTNFMIHSLERVKRWKAPNPEAIEIDCPGYGDWEVANDMGNGRYSKEQILALSEHIKEEDFNLTFEEHLDRFRGLLKAGTIIATPEMKKLALDMVDKCVVANSADYKNVELTRAVANHESTLVFFRDAHKVIKDVISKNKGNVDVYRYKRAGEITDLSTLLKEHVLRPSYGGFFEIGNGLGILLHGIWSYNLKLKNLNITSSGATYTLEAEISDHFGLDYLDLKNELGPFEFGEVKAFVSWFILQHWDAFKDRFKPIPTVMTVTQFREVHF